MEMEAAKDMTTIRHPKIRKVIRQLEWVDGEWKHVLIVKADLTLNTLAEDYDSAAVENLVNAISSSLKKANAGFHKIKIEEA